MSVVSAFAYWWHNLTIRNHNTSNATIFFYTCKYVKHAFVLWLEGMRPDCSRMHMYSYIILESNSCHFVSSRSFHWRYTTGFSYWCMDSCWYRSLFTFCLECMHTTLHELGKGWSYTAISIYVVGSKLRTYATRPNGSVGRNRRLLHVLNTYEIHNDFVDFSLFLQTCKNKVFKPQRT